MGSMSFGIPECFFFDPISHYDGAPLNTSFYAHLNYYQEELEDYNKHKNMKTNKETSLTAQTHSTITMKKKKSHKSSSKYMQKDMEILCSIQEDVQVEEEDEEEGEEEEGERERRRKEEEEKAINSINKPSKIQ